MIFKDVGIVINVKKYGDAAAIVKILSEEHGVLKCFLQNAKSKFNSSIFQTGNIASFEYRSRNSDQFGSLYFADLVQSYNSEIIFSRLNINCINFLFAIIDNFFLEKESCKQLFLEIKDFLELISKKDDKFETIKKFIEIELEILKTLGYGIDLSCCVVTKSTQDLYFISPKSSKAVSFEAGKAYEDKLFKLPKFFLNKNHNSSLDELKNALNISEFFLTKYVFCDIDQNRKNLYKNDRVKILEML